MAQPRIFTSADDLKAAVGEQLGHTDWLDIDQKRIDLFADATGDHQSIHVDPEQAAAGPLGTTIAHGYLTLSLLPLGPQLISVEGVKMGINYGTNKVRFPAPVPLGSRLRATATITRRRRRLRRRPGDRRLHRGARGRRQARLRRRVRRPLLLLDPGGPSILWPRRAPAGFLSPGPHHPQHEVGVQRADLVRRPRPVGVEPTGHVDAERENRHGRALHVHYVELPGRHALLDDRRAPPSDSRRSATISVTGVRTERVQFVLDDPRGGAPPACQRTKDLTAPARRSRAVPSPPAAARRISRAFSWPILLIRCSSSSLVL
ncbi:hypothetical protein SGRIM128S_02156 [Streptomyces griseomycini]